MGASDEVSVNLGLSRMSFEITPCPFLNCYYKFSCFYLGGVVMCYVHLCVCRFLMNVCEKCAGHSLSYVQVP